MEVPVLICPEMHIFRVARCHKSLFEKFNVWILDKYILTIPEGSLSSECYCVGPC